MNSQPACVFFGDLVRREMKTAVPRDATDRQTAAEGIVDAVATDPALALEQFDARASEQKFARERGIITSGEYVVQTAGACMGDTLPEGYLIPRASISDSAGIPKSVLI